MIRLLEVIGKYRILDLIPFAFSSLIDSLDLAISTTVFYGRCCWHGVIVGSGAKIWGRVGLRRFPGSVIRIGNGLHAVCRPGRYAFNIFPQAIMRTYSPSSRIEIGDRVGFNSIAIFCRSQKISIGSGTLIGGNCQISDTDGHPLWPPESRSFYPGTEHDAPVTIGKNVFIGLNVTILKGTSIGDNSVIAAGSVVTGDIPRNCLVAGIPARVVRVLGGAEGDPEGNR